MLTLTWEDLNDLNFSRAISSLAGNPKVDKVTAYRAGRIWEAGISMAKKLQKIEASKKTECGIPEKGPIDPAAKERYESEMEKLLKENKVKIKVHPLDYDKIEGVAGVNLVALEKVMKTVPDII